MGSKELPEMYFISIYSRKKRTFAMSIMSKKKRKKGKKAQRNADG